MRRCRNPHCGEELVAGRVRGGMCNGCYQFHRRTGRHRRHEDRKQGRRLCRTCHLALSVCGGECDACHCYRRRHGVRRPAHLYRETCRICARPLLRDGRGAKGRCQRCYLYYWRYGRDRHHLAPHDAPMGWCDCGEPATTEIAVTVKQATTVTLKLCDECAEAERRIA